MNVDKFKAVIRAIVKEEIQKTLPVLVPKIIAEALNNKQNNSKIISESIDNSGFFDELNQQLSSNRVIKKEQPKRKFSNNPILNDVLNETIGGVPQDPTYAYGAPDPEQLFRQPAQHFNVITPTVEIPQRKEPVVSSNPAPVLINEQTKAQAQVGIYKDYSQLMKKVDAKKKAGGFGGMAIPGLSIEGGIPNDFSTID